MMTDKDLTDDVLDEIIAGAKTSMEQYLALSLKAERAANRQQNQQQNIPENIPGGLVEAVNNLLNNDGSRGCYSAIGCGEAREKIELWLAQRQKWESKRNENLCDGNSPVIPDGWKLVPIDPTKDMLRAGQSVVGFWLNTVHCYSKMLAAAPAAPQQEVKP
ncbi:hypothetical protein ISN40_10220 [Enterobacter asburiae]|uniref:hypothetical protein n=1 Tax=Enterobacter asburiae TaxID=61645 RepID=UPI001887CAA1|nr:hypothetical protein [Enterobacter asburiae]MBF2790585.1 hypothetical protein [Enterobacter asburiae]